MSPISPAPSGCFAAGDVASIPQFATHNAHYGGGHPRAGRQSDAIGNSSACTAWARRSTTRSSSRACWPALPGLRAGRQPRGSARLSRAAAARKRRQHLVRQPHRRRTRSRSMRSSPTRSRGLARAPEKPHPRIPLPRDLYQPARRNSSRSRSRRSAHAGAVARRAGAGRRRTRPGAGADRRRHRNRRRARRPSSIPPTIVGRSASVSIASGRSGRQGARRRRKRRAGLGPDARRHPRGDARTRGRSLRARSRRADGADHPRGRPDDPDALSEVREAVDHLRYYAARARAEFARSRAAARPDRRAQPRSPCTGAASLPASRRGIFRWRSLPGQIAAALAAGNAVIAKPAEQTPLVAAAAVRLLLEAGIPRDVLHLLPGAGETVGARARRRSAHCRRRLHRLDRHGRAPSTRRSRQRAGPIVPLIAETGGQNAMIVDSSALPEQVVADVADLGLRQRRPALLGAAPALPAGRHRRPGCWRCWRARWPSWRSATRRCSPPISARSSTPTARAALERHAERMEREAQAALRMPAAARPPSTAPSLRRAPSRSTARAGSSSEVFGPILHVVRWRADRLDAVLDEIDATGYGLTLGIHSRIDATVRAHPRAARASATPTSTAT